MTVYPPESKNPAVEDDDGSTRSPLAGKVLSVYPLHRLEGPPGCDEPPPSGGMGKAEADEATARHRTLTAINETMPAKPRLRRRADGDEDIPLPLCRAKHAGRAHCVLETRIGPLPWFDQLSLRDPVTCRRRGQGSHGHPVVPGGG